MDFANTEHRPLLQYLRSSDLPSALVHLTNSSYVTPGMEILDVKPRYKQRDYLALHPPLRKKYNYFCVKDVIFPIEHQNHIDFNYY